MFNIAMEYKLSTEQINKFQKLVVLDNIYSGSFTPSLILTGNDELLEDILSEMVGDGLLSLKASGYKINSKGKKEINNLFDKLCSYRDVYKIYSAIDTGAGEIAYESYYEFDTDEAFIEYINQDRFEDLRVAVSILKGIDPFEMVFLEMMDDGRFDSNQYSNWQIELFTKDVWDELENIVNSAIKPNDLNEEKHSGEEVLEIIIDKATQVAINLLEQYDDLDIDEFEECVITVEEHFDPYYKENYF